MSNCFIILATAFKRIALKERLLHARNMCIVFLYFNDNPGPEGYRLIMASNRDEFYSRPAAAAQFWETNPQVLGGVDLFPGKEGGTWLGISKTGKFGVLTNYRQSPDMISTEKLGRGSLATDFLNGNESAADYMAKIKSDGHLYNGFNLLVGEMSLTSPTKAYCYCNMEEKTVQKLEPGFHGLSNRTLNSSWPKIIYGKLKFTEIVKGASDEQDMIDKLFLLLNERRRHFPDEDDSCYTSNPLDERVPEPYKEACRSIFVHFPEIGYGTRTNTVVTVNVNGRVTFVEKTMADGEHNPDSQNWITHRYEFEYF